MKKIDLKKILNQFKQIFDEFPLTIITIMFLTIFFSVVMENDFVNEKIIENVMIFGTIFGITNFFIESVFENKSKKFKIILYVINACIAGVITIGFNQKEAVLGISNEKFIEYLIRFTVCYSLSIIIYALIKNYKKSECQFNEYVTKVVVNMFKVTIVYTLLALGLLLISVATIILLFEKNDFDLIARIQILLLGIYYIPKILDALCNINDEIAKFAKAVIKYALDVMVFIAFIIIYLYIIKLIILRQMPSNQIFRICAGLFIIGCPIWTMASYVTDEDIIGKINKKLPYAFIPFIFLQLYSIGVRIKAYGITPLRYIGLVLIVFEALYIINYIKNKERMEKLFIEAIVLILISGIIPFVNMFKLSEISQYHNLKTIKQNQSVTNEQMNKIKGAYRYLNKTESGKQIIDNLLTQEEKNKILEYNDYHYTERQKEYINARKDIKEINLEDYNKIYIINESEYSKKIKIDDFDNIVINLDNKTKINVNIKGLIQDYINHNENFNEYFKTHNEFIINNEKKLILNSISITYLNDSKNIESYYIDGYILTK